jgi:diadenosine tetraphosphatase ApaH/serine/threonine PP2A family protein phosphatase
MSAAPPFDSIVNLGDIVGYGASPNEVTERVRELGGVLIRGNHDKVVTGLENLEGFNPIAALAALWNREQLTADNLRWLRDLPAGPATLPQLEAVQFVHGAPDDEDRYLLTIEDALPPLLESPVTITFFGHTHIQGTFLAEDGQGESLYPSYASIGQSETLEFELKSEVRYLINPGSVGQPRDGDWRAAFALFDSEQRVVTFCRVPYDLRSAQERIFSSSLPRRLATRLAAGR